ncbi:hypothetical protein [Microbulbifer sp. TYP-18]|uniref:hypothetical protein n=1 Tax=Microbulbifer sp. TYP-18 TaxID=3230024 RepID=UPI0034C61E99
MKYLLIACIFIFGCDHFPGPNIRSEFPKQVKLKISYSDGNIFSYDWPPCRVFGLGAMEVGRFGVREKNVSIEEIIIESEGKVIHRFGEAMINSLLEKEKIENNYPIWIIDESGIHFSTDVECSIENIIRNYSFKSALKDFSDVV